VCFLFYSSVAKCKIWTAVVIILFFCLSIDYTDNACQNGCFCSFTITSCFFTSNIFRHGHQIQGVRRNL